MGQMTYRNIGLIGILGALIAFTTPAPAAIPEGAIHPAFDIKQIPLPDMYITMGIGFLSDGRMVLLTSGILGGGEVPNPDPNSCVFLVSGMKDLANIQVTKIASNFRQPTGVNVVNDKIYVADRDAFYSIPSNTNVTDPATNRAKVLAWPAGALWHHWVFTPIYANGKFYAPYSGSIRVGGLSDVPATDEYSGAFLQWDPDGKNLIKYCGGLRSPNGANINASGDMFVMDNQGSWLPADAFMHMKKSMFYGHRQNPPNAPNWAESLPYQPPAVWIPYPSQIAGASNSQPIYVEKGIYSGQWLGGDANGPGLIRIALEKVNGDYQGAVFHFTNGTSNAGINRLSWGPDGGLYMGSVEQYGNWPGTQLMPMYKMTAKPGVSVFEMLAIHSFKDGFEIEFTEPVSKSTVVPANFSVKQWHYSRGSNYGCCKDADEARTVSDAQLSNDGKRVFIAVGNLKSKDYVVDIKLAGLKSAAGQSPWDNEAWYTLNNISENVWNGTVGLAQKNRHAESPLETSVHQEIRGLGILDVTVVAMGAYSVSLRTLNGTLIREIAGQGGQSLTLSSGSRNPGLYLLEIHHAQDVLIRKVMF